MNAIGSEKAIFNALAKAVGVDGIAEVKVGVAILVAQRSGGHAKLEGGLKVLENFAPGRTVFCAAAMALVDNDEVEEIGGEFFVEAGPVFVLSDRLIGREIEFATIGDSSAFDFDAGIAERSEDFVLRIINEESAIGKVENARLSGGIGFGIPLG
jgi:hypothetical protein